jgi:hypothetical protein
MNINKHIRHIVNKNIKLTESSRFARRKRVVDPNKAGVIPIPMGAQDGTPTITSRPLGGDGGAEFRPDYGKPRPPTTTQSNSPFDNPIAFRGVTLEPQPPNYQEEGRY